MSDEFEQADPPIVRRGRPPNARIQRPPEHEPEREEAVRPDQRLRRARRTDDPLYIDPRIVPPGMSWEWKREKVHGATDETYMYNLMENHWAPVDAEKAPHLVAKGHQGAVRKGGLILMERPAYLTQEARQEDYELAMGEVHRKEASLLDAPPGTFVRDHPSVRKQHRIVKTVEPLVIGEDG
jgi:hypothetical protein